jgi:hypothetical protein
MPEFNIKELYQRCHNGYPLTTPELEFYADYMKQVEELLRPLGDEFRIVCTHATMDRISAEGYLMRRAENAS